jgi:hypothetical protein
VLQQLASSKISRRGSPRHGAGHYLSPVFPRPGGSSWDVHFFRGRSPIHLATRSMFFATRPNVSIQSGEDKSGPKQRYVPAEPTLSSIQSSTRQTKRCERNPLSNSHRLIAEQNVLRLRPMPRIRLRARETCRGSHSSLRLFYKFPLHFNAC